MTTTTEPRLMNELFTAYYSNDDGFRSAVYEKTLNWIYAHQHGRRVEIRPTIWLWKATSCPVFFVDYIGNGISCTLDTFERLQDAEEYKEKIGNMDEKAFEDWLINVRWAKKEG